MEKMKNGLAWTITWLFWFVTCVVVFPIGLIATVLVAMRYGIVTILGKLLKKIAKRAVFSDGQPAYEVILDIRPLIVPLKEVEKIPPERWIEP